MLVFFKKIFTVLLSNTVNASNHKKCLSLNNLKFMTKLAYINLHRNEYS